MMRIAMDACILWGYGLEKYKAWMYFGTIYRCTDVQIYRFTGYGSTLLTIPHHDPRESRVAGRSVVQCRSNRDTVITVCAQDFGLYHSILSPDQGTHLRGLYQQKIYSSCSYLFPRECLWNEARGI
jgi:hypothetical protein